MFFIFRAHKYNKRAVCSVIKLMKKPLLFATLLSAALVACTDDDAFSTSPNRRLTFSTDTVRLDTVFSRVPTATHTFWVYNRSGSGLRLSNVRLQNGNQTGYRVNVDGSWLSSASGFQVSDLEVRDKDSCRVFVELTSALNGKDTPQKVEDNLVFTLESGVEQRVCLSALSWDASVIRSLTLERDTTLEKGKPIIVYGGITVPEGRTLTLQPGVTLYFHADAALTVNGTLHAQGTPEENVTLRGDRLDRMFDYLPYDGVSGQWQGVRLGATSFDNVIAYTDIHSTMDGVVCDSSALDRQKLTMTGSIVHNCNGTGVKLRSVRATLDNCQLSNTLGACLQAEGGDVALNNCTLAQFYPFDANRGPALAFANHDNTYDLPLTLSVRNSIVTGWANDVVEGSVKDSTITFDYHFDHCLLRTPKDSTDERLTDVTFEDVKDTARYGERLFRLVDADLQRFDFRLSRHSAAIGCADPLTALPTDRKGIRREDKPDLGCYQHEEE